MTFQPPNGISSAEADVVQLSWESRGWFRTFDTLSTQTQQETTLREVTTSFYFNICLCTLIAMHQLEGDLEKILNFHSVCSLVSSGLASCPRRRLWIIYRNWCKAGFFFLPFLAFSTEFNWWEKSWTGDAQGALRERSRRAKFQICTDKFFPFYLSSADVCSSIHPHSCTTTLGALRSGVKKFFSASNEHAHQQAPARQMRFSWRHTKEED